VVPGLPALVEPLVHRVRKGFRDLQEARDLREELVHLEVLGVLELLERAVRTDYLVRLELRECRVVLE